MLYEQLCGRRPFTGLNTEEVLNRISEGKPRRPTEFDPSVPLALELVCLTALSKDPTRRFPSLHEFIAAIEAVGGQARVATSGEVGEYVTSIFPAEEDPKRIALRRARLADPSTPTHRARDAIAMDLLPPREESRPPRKEPPGPPPGPSAWQRRMAWAREKVFRVEVLGPAALALVVIAGAVAFATRPERSVADRLQLAEKASSPGQRIRELTALAEDPSATETDLRRAGELALQSPDLEGALAVTQAFARRFPKSIEAALQEARACVGLRLGKKADAAIDRAINLGPDDPRPDLLRADLRRLQGDAGGMLDALTSASRKAPNDREIAVRRGELLSQAGRLDEASGVLSAVLKHRFRPGAAAELGFVKMRQNQSTEAMRLLRASLSRSPNLAKAHYYLGAVLTQQGDVGAAESEYRTADRLAPSDPRPLGALCALFAQNKRGAEAEALRKELADRFPEQAPRYIAECRP
jgi:Flp pilus assembly protein TadD